MLKKGSYYPGHVSNDEVLLFLKRHVFAFLWPMGVLIIFMIIGWLVFLFYFFSALMSGNLLLNAPNWFIVIIISTYAYIILVVTINAWMSWYLDVTIVTRSHLVDINQQGIFNRKVSEQSLLRIQDVSAKVVGFWQTWWRYGTIFVETAGESPNFIMPNIRRPNVAANDILKLHDELVARGGYESMIAEGVGDVGLVQPHHKISEPKNVPDLKEMEKNMLNEAYKEDIGLKNSLSSESSDIKKDEILPDADEGNKIMEAEERISMAEGEEVLPNREEHQAKIPEESASFNVREENRASEADKEKDDNDTENLEEGKTIKF